MKRLFVVPMTLLCLFAAGLGLTQISTNSTIRSSTSSSPPTLVTPPTRTPPPVLYGGSTISTPTQGTQHHHRGKKHPQAVVTPVPTPMPSGEGKVISGGVNPWKQESK
jgi:hypothetical protein